MIGRRYALGAMAVMAVLVPGRMSAQPTGRRHVAGILTASANMLPPGGPMDASFQNLGYKVGETLVLERRSWDGDPTRLARAAAELVRLRPDVLIAFGNRETAALQQVTSTIPIVMVFGVDPVSAGFTDSLARPSRNVTGNNSIAGKAVRAKRLQMLKLVMPELTRVAVLREKGTNSPDLDSELDAAASSLNLDLQVFELGAADELERTLAAIASARAPALFIDGSSILIMAIRRITEFALQQHMAATWLGRSYAQGGLLFTYGLVVDENSRRAAVYVDRLLKGAKPESLPIEQPAEFELVVNLKTARAIGVKIPNSMLLQANEVIE